MSEIKYTFERRDFVALSRALARRSWLNTFLKLLLPVVIVAHIVIFVWLRGAHHVPPGYVRFYVNLLPFWFFPLVFALVSPQVVGLLAACLFKNNFSANKEIMIALQENSILAHSEDNRSDVSWKSIVKVIETDRHLFLALSKREALVLPKRAFASEGELTQALGFIEAHVSPQTPMVKHQWFRTTALKPA